MNANPYAAPQAHEEPPAPSGPSGPNGPSGPSGPRPLSRVQVALAGALLGAVAFSIALALVPSWSGADEYRRLAIHLGFIYPMMLGFWVGWYRRSWFWVRVGGATCLIVGTGYTTFCLEAGLLDIIVFMPSLLGGLISVLLGTGDESWFKGVAHRLGKGMVAGFVLGLTYLALLWGLGLLFLGLYANYSEYMTTLLSRGGVVAMSFASALYLMLFHWSIGLEFRKEESPTRASGN